MQRVTLASCMTRNLNDDMKPRLRMRAADNGRSMKKEARLVPSDAIGHKGLSGNIASAIRVRNPPRDGIDLNSPSCEFECEPPALD